MASTVLDFRDEHGVASFTRSLDGSFVGSRHWGIIHLNGSHHPWMNVFTTAKYAIWPQVSECRPGRWLNCRPSSAVFQHSINWYTQHSTVNPYVRPMETFITSQCWWMLIARRCMVESESTRQSGGKSRLSTRLFRGRRNSSRYTTHSPVLHKPRCCSFLGIVTAYF